MKKVGLILIVLFTLISSTAQQNTVVSLKNGSVLKGELLKNDETGVQLRMRDGSIWNFTKEEVASTEKFSPTVSKSGFYNRSTLGVMGGDQLSPSLHIVNGYVFNPHWETGLGIGLEHFWWDTYLPVFIEGRYNLLDRRITPFVSILAGYEVPVRNFQTVKGGITSNIQLGMTHYISDRVGITTSVGYRFAQLRVMNSWWDDFTTIQQINRFEVRVGLVFR